MEDQSHIPGDTEPPDDLSAAAAAVETDPSGRYLRFAHRLGSGASKTVYKAFDRTAGMEVAWSRISISEDDDAAAAAATAEVDLLTSLRHASIIDLHHSWFDSGGQSRALNLITELFPSGSLLEHRRRHPSAADGKAIRGWARQILASLEYLHGRSPPVLHRDLKCDNLFVSGDGRVVKIGDFGLATEMDGACVRTVVGTPPFMAPELYDEEYDELADIYSFGMCVLEMVAGELPYGECHNNCQIFKKVTSGVKPLALGKVEDPEVKAFIEKCISPKEQRPSARDLLKDPFLRIEEEVVPKLEIVVKTVAQRKIGAEGFSSVLPKIGGGVFGFVEQRMPLMPSRCIPMSIRLPGCLDFVEDDGGRRRFLSTASGPFLKKLIF